MVSALPGIELEKMMIKSVYIDGLKSLKELNLEFKPGLNALVGPNGSGKTNILTAFEILSNHMDLEPLPRRNLLETIKIMDLFNENNQDKRLKIIVKGDLETELKENDLCHENYNGELKIDYTYDFEIKYDPEKKAKLYFNRQFLEIKIHSETEYNSKYRDCIDFMYNGDELKINIDKNLKSNKLFVDTALSYYNNNLNNLKFRSLIHEFTTNFSPLEKIGRDFESGKVHNIDPRLVRESIYELAAPEINGNGTGLLSLLLKIKEGKIYNEEYYNILIENLRSVLPDVQDMNVFRNPDKIGEITGTVKFCSADGTDYEISVGLMSDGTLKYLALLSALLTAKEMFVLDELENSLHPGMQKQILNLIRSTMDDEKQIRIIATHSETILNKLDPSEIHLTYFRNGRTHVKHIEDEENLRCLMHDSGFGFGWFYLNGDFDYENMNLK